MCDKLGKSQNRAVLSVITDLLTSASSVCIGRLPSLWTGTCRADPLSRWAPHTGKHLKPRNTPEQILNLITPTRTPPPPISFPFTEPLQDSTTLFGMSYILPPPHTLSTLKIGALTFKQAPQAVFDLGGWDNMHCTGKEGETKKRELWSLRRGLPEGWSHPGA